MMRRLRQWVARTAVKSFDLRLVPRWMRHAWSTIRFEQLADEGYRKNSAVFACVRLWANSFPEPRLTLVNETPEGPTLLPGHPLQRLIKRPNPRMSERMLMTYAVTYMAVGGDCFLFKERNQRGDVIALWPLHAGQITPVAATGSGWLSHYLYKDDVTEHRVEASEIVQIMWAPDPLNPLRGLSPLIAAARSVDTDAAAQAYVFNLLKNDAVPLTVVTLKEPVGETRLKQLKAQFKQGFGGDSTGEPMFIEGDEASVSRLGASLGDLAAEALHNIPESRIAAAFEVPAVMVGLHVGLSRAIQGAPAEMQEGWTETVRVPRWRLVQDQIDLGLRDDFKLPDTAAIEYDLNEVAALEGSREKSRATARADFRAGLITRNEALSATGREPVDGGDVYLVPSSTVEVPAGEASPTRAAEPADADALAAELLGIGAEGQASREPSGVKALTLGELTQRQERDKRELLAELEAALVAEFAAIREGVAGRVAA